MSTVHDLTPLLFKTGKASTKTSIIYKTKYTAYKLLLKNQIRRSEKIITPTNTVKKQIVSIFGKEVSDKIIPIYEGIDEALITVKPDTEIIKKNNIHNYFLYVGNFYPHKNVERLIEAFKSIPETHTLVLAGPNDFFAERMRELIKGFNLQKRVKMLHNTDKSELKALYINAQALVHASLSEGFGLPLIEAVSLDIPVIASNIEVYRELLNTNYVSFDPTDSKDIAGKIISFIEDKPKFDYNTILKKFSFKNMAEKHYQVYSELLS